MARLFAALLSLLLVGGDRRLLVGWSSLTSIIKLRLAMMGERRLSKWKPDAKLGVHSPVGLLKRTGR